MSKLLPIEHKVSFVAKDYETAFHANTRHVSQITILRGWSLTVCLGYIGFIASVRPEEFFILLPLEIVLLLFMYLETRQRDLMVINDKNVREIEKIFMETDPERFSDMIKCYKFRDLQLTEHRASVGQMRKLKERCRKMFAKGMIAWHLLLFSLVVFTYIAIVLV